MASRPSSSTRCTRWPAASAARTWRCRWSDSTRCGLGSAIPVAKGHQLTGARHCRCAACPAHRAVGNGPAAGGGSGVPRRRAAGDDRRAAEREAARPADRRPGRGHGRPAGRRRGPRGRRADGGRAGRAPGRTWRQPRRAAAAAGQRRSGPAAFDLAARRGAGTRPDPEPPVDDRLRQLAAAGRAALRPAERPGRRAGCQERRGSAEHRQCERPLRPAARRADGSGRSSRRRARSRRPRAPRLGVPAGAQPDRGGAQGGNAARLSSRPPAWSSASTWARSTW